MKTTSLFHALSPGGLALTATHSGNGTASAVMYPDRIIIDYTALGSSETVTVTTPASFTVVDAHAISASTVGSKTLTVKNNTSAVSSAMSIATANKITRTTDVVQAQASFSAGDDELVIASSANADGDGKAVIAIELD